MKQDDDTRPCGSALSAGLGASGADARKTTNKTLIACLLLALAGCQEYKPAAESSQTNNAAIQVDTLFTKDGCTVYRFEDGGRYRYFVRCENGQSRTEWTESCGRNCTHAVEVPGA